jgi:hypothetical protein
VDVDKRANIFKSWYFVIFVPVMVFVLFFSVWHLYKFFHPEASKPSSLVASVPGAVPGVVAPGQKAASSEGGKGPSVDISLDLRIVGSYVASGQVVYLISDDGRVRKMVQPLAAKQTQYDTEILMPDGRFASRFWFLPAKDTQKTKVAP